MAVRTGDTLLAGRYRVLRSLGAGGMATVALCEDERLGRRVAVKRLHAHGSEDDQRRFAREARVGASLNHPNLVAVYDTATDAESVLIVMEYVEGETLAGALGRGPLPVARALSVIRGVASALEHAHAHGIVHRDVKPANILLREDGETKLVDLGIAMAADSTSITESGTVLGTAAYMAPEQLDGRPAGPAADVYALAAVAFEALSGRKARQGRTPVEVAHRVATEPPPDLTEVWPDAPPDAARALREGMARDPADRPTPGRLAERLERALLAPARAATRVQPAPSEAAPPPASRRVFAFVALALVALAVAAVVLLAGGGDSTQERPTTPGGTDSRAPSGESGGAGGEVQRRPQPRTSKRPAAPAATPRRSGDASGPRLDAEGYALMRQGRFEEAIPILRRAVGAFPEGTSDVRYAYALFNLGSALRQAGRPREAIPILERRLQIPNQTNTVRRELEAARREAGRGGDE